MLSVFGRFRASGGGAGGKRGIGDSSDSNRQGRFDLDRFFCLSVFLQRQTVDDPSLTPVELQ